MYLYTVLLKAPQSHSKGLFLLVVRWFKLKENSIYTVLYTVVVLARLLLHVRIRVSL